MNKVEKWFKEDKLFLELISVLLAFLFGAVIIAYIQEPRIFKFFLAALKSPYFTVCLLITCSVYLFLMAQIFFKEQSKSTADFSSETKKRIVVGIAFVFLMTLSLLISEVVSLSTLATASVFIVTIVFLALATSRVEIKKEQSSWPQTQQRRRSLEDAKKENCILKIILVVLLLVFIFLIAKNPDFFPAPDLPIIRSFITKGGIWTGN